MHTKNNYIIKNKNGYIFNEKKTIWEEKKCGG